MYLPASSMHMRLCCFFFSLHVSIKNKTETNETERLWDALSMRLRRHHSAVGNYLPMAIEAEGRSFYNTNDVMACLNVAYEVGTTVVLLCTRFWVSTPPLPPPPSHRQLTTCRTISRPPPPIDILRHTEVSPHPPPIDISRHVEVSLPPPLPSTFYDI